MNKIKSEFQNEAENPYGNLQNADPLFDPFTDEQKKIYLEKINETYWTPYHYAVFNYVHDSSISEFLHFGIAIYVPASGWFRGKVSVDSADRFALAFSEFDRNWYLDVVKGFNDYFSKISKKNNIHPDIEYIVREAGFRKSNNLVYSISCGIVEFGDKKYNELFEHLYRTYIYEPKYSDIKTVKPPQYFPQSQDDAFYASVYGTGKQSTEENMEDHLKRWSAS